MRDPIDAVAISTETPPVPVPHIPTVAWWDHAHATGFGDELAKWAFVPDFRVPTPPNDAQLHASFFHGRRTGSPTQKAREAWQAWAAQHPAIGLEDIYTAARSFASDNAAATGRTYTLRAALWAQEMVARAGSPSEALEALGRGLTVPSSQQPSDLILVIVAEAVGQWIAEQTDSATVIGRLLEMERRWGALQDGDIRATLVDALDMVLCSDVPFAMHTTLPKRLLGMLSVDGRICLLHRWALAGRHVQERDILGLLGDADLAARVTLGFVGESEFPRVFTDYLTQHLSREEVWEWSPRRALEIIESLPPSSTIRSKIRSAVEPLRDQDDSIACRATALLERWDTETPSQDQDAARRTRDADAAPAWWHEDITPQRALLCATACDTIPGALRHDIAHRVMEGAGEILHAGSGAEPLRRAAWESLKTHALLDASRGIVRTDYVHEVVTRGGHYPARSWGRELRLRALAAETPDVALLACDAITSCAKGEDAAVRWAIDQGYTLGSPWETVVTAFAAWRASLEAKTKPAVEVLGIALVRANPTIARTLWMDHALGRRLLSATSEMQRHGLIHAALWATDQPGEVLERVREAASALAPESTPIVTARSRGVVEILLSDPRWYGISPQTDEWVEANLTVKHKRPAQRLQRLHLTTGNWEAANTLLARFGEAIGKPVRLGQLGCPGHTPSQVRALIDLIRHTEGYHLGADSATEILFRETSGVHAAAVTEALHTLFPSVDASDLLTWLQGPGESTPQLSLALTTPTIATWEDWERTLAEHGETWATQGYTWYARSTPSFGRAPEVRFTGGRAPAGIPHRILFEGTPSAHDRTYAREEWPEGQPGITKREWYRWPDTPTVSTTRVHLTLDATPRYGDTLGQLILIAQNNRLTMVCWGDESRTVNIGFLGPGRITVASPFGQQLLARCARQPSDQPMEALAGLFANPALARCEHARLRGRHQPPTTRGI
jgi:hypothetical protein